MLDILFAVEYLVLIFHVGYLVLNLWCRVSGIKSLVSSIWCRVFGVEYLVSSIWCFNIGIEYSVLHISCQVCTRYEILLND